MQISSGKPCLRAFDSEAAISPTGHAAGSADEPEAAV